jgi:hypothetical protein
MLTVNSAATDQLYTTNRHTIESISPSSNVLGSNNILELIIGSFNNLYNFYPTQEINSLRSSPTVDQLRLQDYNSQSICKLHLCYTMRLLEKKRWEKSSVHTRPARSPT